MTPRSGLFLSTLFALGALPILPQPKSQEELDREAAEREEQRRLRAVNFGAPVQMRMTAQGAISGKTSFAEAYAREVEAREAYWARVTPVLVAARVAASMQVKPERDRRDRQAQREAKKGRKAAKQQRGW